MSFTSIILSTIDMMIRKLVPTRILERFKWINKKTSSVSSLGQGRLDEINYVFDGILNVISGDVWIFVTNGRFWEKCLYNVVVVSFLWLIID